jgi:hypothetical protein
MRPASGKERTGQTTRHRRNSFLPRTVAFVAILVGCGETNRDEIESAVKGFDSALAAGDGRKACGFLSESARAEIERRGACEKLAAGLSRPGRRTAREVMALGSGKVSAVTVEGTVATVQVQAPGGYPKRSVELEETEGGWKISETPLGP